MCTVGFSTNLAVFNTNKLLILAKAYPTTNLSGTSNPVSGA